MRPRDLTERQRKILAEQIGRHLDYYTRLVTRLDRVGMDRDSKLYLEAAGALDAVHRLRITTMYLAIDKGQTG